LHERRVARIQTGKRVTLGIATGDPVENLQ